MTTENEICKSLMVRKDIHREIAKLASWHSIKMKDITSALLEYMLQKHPEELEEIIKKLKMKKF